MDASTSLRVVPWLLAATALLGCGSGGPVDPDPCPPDCPQELPGTWSAAARMPEYRREMPVALLDGRIYVAGGIGESRSVLASMDVYDRATDRWSSAPSMPEPRHHHGAAGANGRLYVIGGYSSLEPTWGPWPPTRTVFEYDPASRTWTERAPMPEALAAMAVAVHEGKVYVFGGSEGSSAFSVSYVYDPAADRWSYVASMPTAREHTVAVTIGPTIYVVSGRSGANRTALEAYSPATDTWRTLAPGPSTSGHAAAALGGKLYVFGGERLGVRPETYDLAREYDPQADRWRQVAPLPSARHGIAATGTGSVIHVFGGNGPAGTENLAFRLP